MDKIGLVVRCRESLGQLLKRRGQAIVRLVARSPEGVAAGVLGRLDNLQDRVVRRNPLEGDAVWDRPACQPNASLHTNPALCDRIGNLLGVPSLRSELLRRGCESVLVEAPVLNRADDADLIVELPVLVDRDAALAVGQSMPVQLGGRGLARQFSKPLSEELLLVDGEALVAEEDDATLGD